ncbi:hypothetical protein CRUP_025664, partial [Coryphaenoides rupestris]
VAKALKVALYETPAGWRYFGNLMDSGRCSLCGEESFGTGSDHIRKKDGLWSVPCSQPPDLLSSDRVSRSYYNLSPVRLRGSGSPGGLLPDEGPGVGHLRTRPSATRSLPVGDHMYGVERADNFEYVDPVDGTVARNQGLRIVFADGSRLLFRISAVTRAFNTQRLPPLGIPHPEVATETADMAPVVRAPSPMVRPLLPGTMRPISPARGLLDMDHRDRDDHDHDADHRDSHDMKKKKGILSKGKKLLKRLSPVNK